MSGDQLNLDALVEWAATERPETDDAVRALVAEVRRLQDLLETGGEEWTRMAEEHAALKSRADLSDEWCRRALAAEMTLEDLTAP